MSEITVQVRGRCRNWWWVYPALRAWAPLAPIAPRLTPRVAQWLLDRSRVQYRIGDGVWRNTDFRPQWKDFG